MWILHHLLRRLDNQLGGVVQKNTNMFFVSILISAVFSFTVSSTAIAFPTAPDPSVTPGSLCDEEDDDFSEYRYGEEIPYCQRGVSQAMRDYIYEVYGISERSQHLYTIDHFIPLALGGDNDPENLWPEHVDIKKLRYNLELDLYLDLRAGIITQEEAVEMIVHAKMNPPLLNSVSL